MKSGFQIIPRKLANELWDCVDVEHFYRQDYYVEVWFEASAMVGQFRHYTSAVNLRPFGGQYSIRRKWEAAKELRKYALQFEKPAIVLYFGDCDDWGREIPENALKDIELWSDFDFEFIPCGLTLEQAEAYGLPENIDKPDSYQWEALPDDKAREIITSNVDKYVDREIIEEVMQEKWDFNREWESRVNEVLSELFSSEID